MGPQNDDSFSLGIKNLRRVINSSIMQLFYYQYSPSKCFGLLDYFCIYNFIGNLLFITLWERFGKRVYSKQKQFCKLDTLSVTGNSKLYKIWSMPLGAQPQLEGQITFEIVNNFAFFKIVPNLRILTTTNLISFILNQLSGATGISCIFSVIGRARKLP